MVRITFEAAKQARSSEIDEFEIDVRPTLMGLSAAALPKTKDEKGKEIAADLVTLVYRGFTTDEYSEILEDIKGEEGRTWIQERNFALLQLCLIEPAIPPTAEGRKFLERWTPGLVVNVAEQVEIASGYRRDYVVRDAKDALKNSESSTPIITSNSK